MTSIQRTDLLQVTARRGGTLLLSLTLSGASTLTDVFRQVRESAPSNAGMVTISLRNRTQGWTQQHNLVFKEPASSQPSVGCSAPAGLWSPSRRHKPSRPNMDEYPSLFQ